MKPIRRQRRGFRRSSELSSRSMGLPVRRAREMRLVGVWRDVAGPALSRHAVVSVARGTLSVAPDEPTWCQAIEPLLPELVAKLAARCPDLAIKRYRVLQPDGELGPVEEIQELSSSPQGSRAVRPQRQDESSARPQESVDGVQRLQQIRERYLSRRDDT